MKIMNNAVGNYGPSIRRSESNDNLTQVRNPVKPAPGNKLEGKEKLSSEEKNFFAALYPDKASEVMEYHFYERSGKLAGVKVGYMFDKRG